VDEASVPGALVLVSNGVYGIGGRVMFGAMTNRVAVAKPLIVRSVNGAAVTVIQGHQVSATTNGNSAVRCVYLADGALLAGFTLTTGATRATGDAYLERSGGGVWCATGNAVVSNCVITGNSASQYGGGVHYGTLNQCTLSGNSASLNGGGSVGGTLIGCTLTGNSASQSGGGAYYGTLTNCTLTANSAGSGGGAYAGTLSNCMVTSNAASDGGGAYSAILNNCTLRGNSASQSGGGADGGTLKNCALTGNSASGGGGMSGGTLTNCTLTDNSATQGGGASGSTLNNCIVYYNRALAEPNYDGGSTLSYCSTTPLPTSGTSNLEAEPQLADFSHLSADSPCRGVGNAAYATGVDIDGEPWANPPSIGCDEFYAGSATGALSVAIQAPYTNVVTGCSVSFVANITGRVSASAWDFADGTVVSNQPYASHGWAAPGDYAMVLRAYNDTYPGGVSATTLVHVVTQPVYYVSLGNLAPQAPYTSWGTAATNILDAVDQASAAGALVLVSNGVYQVGGRVASGSLTNRLAVTGPLIVQSVNGPAVTIIQGYQAPDTTNGDSAVRCVYLADGAVLAGFTLTNGATRSTAEHYIDEAGGGAYCAAISTIVSNCVIAGNSASQFGGGAAGGTLNNCALAGNSAGSYGGGAYYGSLNKCTLVGNSAMFGGGAYLGTLNNCTLTRNSAEGGGGAVGGTLNNCALAGNSAGFFGGGVTGGTQNNCILTNNSASQEGGGADYSTLNNCALTVNWATNGGGAAYSTLINCTLMANSAQSGGGAYVSTLTNCIVFYNSAATNSNCQAGWTINCCTTPRPASGTGNITNVPLFVDQAGGSLRLEPTSPCINAGNNSCVTASTDLDGNPRIVGGTVDIGAYEYQGSGSVISYAWLQQYGLATDGSADHTDADLDGMNNWQEWVAGTDPTDATSLLRLLPPVFTAPSLLLRWWSTDTNYIYFIERASGFATTPAFSLLQTNIPGGAGMTSFNDTTAPLDRAAFYRVGTDSTNAVLIPWLDMPQFMPANVTVTWASVTNRSYSVERSTSLLAPMLFAPVTTNVPGQAGMTSYTDTSATGAGPFLFRVRVQ
jgi:parallel beta-helix repeat protein